MEKLLFGVAYYDEYMPYDRLNEDIKMMKSANINVVRIAESTWSSVEPQNGEFDFKHIDRVIDAMEEAGISVIIGTPTYAIPTWLVSECPEALAVTKSGQGVYGTRQNMDITNPTYLFYAERVIRKIMDRVSKRKCVIGYQLDNETKHYDTAGSNVQHLFIKYLRKKFPNINDLNDEFGLAYWSNRINSWEDFPNVLGTINGSLGAEFEKFQRTLVNKFLSWQSDIVNEYKRENQFVTQNFDFEWRGYSFGVQPKVNHFEASKCLTIAGVDIYHPTQDYLTGTEISFGGDMTRSLKNDNYLVLETEAQGFEHWVPYDGQLRLQAFSHVASGANSVMYWHWHSIHNSAETYWKGLLSHDFKENPTYNESKIIGDEFNRFGDKLVNLKKKNDVAILVSNEALTAIEWFSWTLDFKYNDVVRWVYDELYKMNVGCDFINPDSEDIEKYKLIVAPALYSAPSDLLNKLNSYVKNGGNLVVTFKSAFTNENVKVSHNDQPNIINKCLGVTYNQFTKPDKVSLKGHDFKVSDEENEVSHWMELLKITTAETIAYYDHPNWGKYSAITKNHYGEGIATYIGCFANKAILKEVLIEVLKEANLFGQEQQYNFPIIIKSGYNSENKKIVYYFNYSCEKKEIEYSHNEGIELTKNQPIKKGEKVVLKPWGLIIVEENK
ncbi:beta-galactosidase [Clostridium gelidum]|uniref:beta-galactosidase n=1 Tax=Clostridium gelidum TaxID=704125 RepID=A0ABM7T510_9CLOT|nr:beta-galactosidase [Clostridium gelidum]BCZ46023.1 beta-galactosidase [Clostridium gelidum]